MFHTLIKLIITFVIVSSGFVRCVINLSQDKEDTIGEAKMTNQIYLSLQNVLFSNIDRYLKSVNRTSSKSMDSFNSPFYLPSFSSIIGMDPFNLPKPIEISHRDLMFPQLGVLNLVFNEVKIKGLSNYRLKKISKEGKSIIVQHFLPNISALANYSINIDLFDQIPLKISKGQVKVYLKNVHINATFLVFPKTFKLWFKVVKLNLTAWTIDEPSMLAFPEFIVTKDHEITESILKRINSFIKLLMPSLTQYLKFTYSKLIEL